MSTNSYLSRLPPRRALSAWRWLPAMAAAAVGAIYGFEFGARLGGALLGAVLALNGALMGGLLAEGAVDAGRRLATLLRLRR